MNIQGTLFNHIEKLQKIMKAENIDFYFIPTCDFHGSEIIASSFKLIPALTGFTGSNAKLLITQSSSYIWTDSRYFLQVENELITDSIIMKEFTPGYPSPIELIMQESEDLLESSSHISEITVAFDGRITSTSWAKKLIESFESYDYSYNLDFTNHELLEYGDRLLPKQKFHSIFPLSIEQTGLTVSDKFNMISESMNKLGLNALYLNKLDDIAWLLNLRGSDIPYTPLFYSFALFLKKEVIIYVADPNSLAKIFDIPDTSSVAIRLSHYTNIWEDLKNIPKDNKLSADFDTIPFIHYAMASKSGCTILNKVSPIPQLRSIKTSNEITNMRIAHIWDALAIIKTWHWIEDSINTGHPIKELDISNKVEFFRKSNHSYIMPSFETIAATGSNAAIVHYTPNPEHNSSLSSGEVLLLDCGGQYMQGTTDMTRTISIGKSIPMKIKLNYTKVLKAHLAMQLESIPDDTLASELDDKVRSTLEKYNLSYGHGTGHGVGFISCVHESPISISPRCNLPIRSGMIFSNEPGFYEKDSHGIRIENLVVAHLKDDRLHILPLTLVPYDLSLVESSLLTQEELSYIKTYHMEIYEKLSPLLNEKIRDWLAEKCGLI